MGQTNAILSYDLRTRGEGKPAGHAEFKAALEKRTWHFSRGSKDLPWSTCFAFWTTTMSEADAREIVVKDVNGSLEEASTAAGFQVTIDRWTFGILIAPPAIFENG